MGTLRDFFRTFSIRSTLKTNIISTPGSFTSMGSNTMALAGGKGSGTNNRMVGSRYMTSYFLRMQEILDYEITQLSETVVGIFKDYLTSYFSDNVTELISIKDPSKINSQNKINSILTQLNYADECKRHLTDIIYHGSYSYKLDWNAEEGKYEKTPLINPHTVIDVYGGSSLKSHLVVAASDKILEVAPGTILRLGSANLSLINDVNPEFDIHYKDEDRITSKTEFLAGTPLYFNISAKIKEFILKDQLSSLLAIKDLIQPLIMLISVDKNTPIDQANQLALNTENMLNKYSDISSLLTTSFSITDLIDVLMNNIRVLPDYSSSGSIGQMNTVDMSRLYDKIENIKREQDTNKEDILNSIGIPGDLFSGRYTRFEAIKNSERLNSKVNSLCKVVDDGLKRTAAQFYKLVEGVDIDPNEFESHMFNKTIVEYNAAKNSIDTIGEMVGTVGRVIEEASNLVRNVDVIDGNQYYNYIMDKMKSIDPDLEPIMPQEAIQKSMEILAQQREEQAGGGGY